MQNIFAIVLSVTMLLLTQCFACTRSERRTEVDLQGGNPPIFMLSGTGSLSDLIIYGKQQREAAGDRRFALWEIEPIGGDETSTPVEHLSITYGVLPKNYKQVYPENGVTPPQLVEEQRYEYWFQTVNAPHARGHFEIRDGKAIKTAN